MKAYFLFLSCSILACSSNEAGQADLAAPTSDASPADVLPDASPRVETDATAEATPPAENDTREAGATNLVDSAANPADAAMGVVAVHPAPPLGRTLLLIGQSGARAFDEYTTATKSLAAGGSVYGELYTGTLSNAAQVEVVTSLEAKQAGSWVEVGLSWKDAMAARGFINIDPNDATPDNYRTVGVEEQIVMGKFDSQIDSIASFIQSHAGVTFLLRVDYEVSTNFHCNIDPAKWNFDTKDCHFYVDAFRYIAQRVHKGVATGNVAFVYHPVRGQAALLYPGDEVVDWVGFSVFNNDLCLPVRNGSDLVNGCTTGTIDPGLAGDIGWAEARGKPVIIAESSVQHETDADPAAFTTYLDRLFGLIDAHPGIRALTYIDIDWRNNWIPGEAWTGPFDSDSRVQRYPETLSRWCKELAGGRYLGASGKPATCGI
jgi:hypothetical protein